MDGWYYRLFEDEFGPITFEELIELAKSQSIAKDSDVRFGVCGAWRKAGSIGQLMAHFPFEAEKRVVVSNPIQTVANQGALNSGTATKLDRSVIASQNSAIPEISSKKNAASYWCLAEGKEYGPVSVQKLREWVASKRLKPGDQVRSGRGPYVLAESLPGLFPRPQSSHESTKVGMSAITETQVMSVVAAKPSGARPKGNSVPSASSAKSEQSPISVAPQALLIPAGGPVARPIVVSSPKVPVRRPALKWTASGDMATALKSKTAISVAGTLLLGAILYFAFPLIPLGDSAKVKQFKQLRGAYLELVCLRAEDNVQSDSFKALSEKLESIAAKVSDELKGSKDPTQRELLKLAKNLQELSKEKLGMKPVPAESLVGKAIKETGSRLGIM